LARIVVNKEDSQHCSRCGAGLMSASSYSEPRIVLEQEASATTIRHVEAPIGSLEGAGDRRTGSLFQLHRRELIDPLLRLRHLLSRVLLACFIFGIVRALLLAVVPGNIALAILMDLASVLFIAVVAGFGPILLMLFMLPEGPTTALYLRSFRTDRQTVRIRTLVQSGLGSEFRLSGIRDPAKRRSIIDYLGLIVFIGRYSTPKYMNLESAGDWLERVATTLSKCRCVFIDVRELSDSVKREILLAWTIAGPARTCFVVDETRPETEWKSVVADHIPRGVDASGADVVEAHIAVWVPTREGARRFRQHIRSFAASLPADVPGIARLQNLPEAAIRVPTRDNDQSSRFDMTSFGGVIGLGIAFGFLTILLVAIPEWINGYNEALGDYRDPPAELIAEGALANWQRAGQIATWITTSVTVCLCVWAIIEHLIYCADNRRRMLMVLATCIVALVNLLVFTFMDM
jgi:hypothetical protein